MGGGGEGTSLVVARVAEDFPDVTLALEDGDCRSRPLTHAGHFEPMLPDGWKIHICMKTRRLQLGGEGGRWGGQAGGVDRW